MAKISKSKVIYQQKLTKKMLCEPITVMAVTSAASAYEAAKQFWDMDEIGITEHFCVLYLNRANMPLAWAEISRGSMEGTLVDAKVVFSHALLAGAHSMILFHNHPSGNLKPSNQDLQITKKLKDGALLLDMAVFDHIIISPDGDFYSFADNDMM